MKKKNYLFFALAALAFTACSSDDELGSGSTSNNQLVAAQISAGIGGTSTRADGATWEADAVGVMVTNSTVSSSATLTMYKNVKYTTTSTSAEAATFKSDDGIYFQDASETVTFAAYGPYQTSTNIATLPETSGVVSGSTSSQSSRDDQKAIDYIYASGAQASKAKPYVIFNDESSSTNVVAAGTSFNHKMSKLVIIIKPSDGLTADQVIAGTYKLSGLYHSGTFDVTSGTAAATTTGEATDDWELSTYSLKKDGETDQVTYTSILYPNNYSTALSFSATIDGQTYSNSSDIKPNLEAGKTYTYTITMTQQGIETVDEDTSDGWTANDWTSGAESDISATM